MHYNWYCRWGSVIANQNFNFHSLEAITSSAEEVIWSCLCEIEHIATAPCDILYEAFVNALLIASLVHLQNIVEVLVKPKILKLQENKKGSHLAEKLVWDSSAWEKRGNLQSQSPTKNCSWLDQSLKLMLGAQVYRPPPTLCSTGSLHFAQNMPIIKTIKHKITFLKFSIFNSLILQEHKS